MSKVSISKWINQLINSGYIESEIVYKEGTKEILSRYLRIINTPIKEKFNTPIKEKFKDNNTSINNTINKENNIKEIAENFRNSWNDFAKRNNWKDLPNIDKFDHLHEELLEMSQYLRYKTEKERLKIIKENKAIFKDGIGDLFFGVCRLAKQLDVDIEEAFNMVQIEILKKYDHKKKENNLVKKLSKE